MDKKKKGQAEDTAADGAKLGGNAPENENSAQTENVPENKEQSGTELPESVTLSKAEFEEVRQHIEKLQKERDDTVSLAQRLQADFDNFRKRNAAIHSDSLDEGVRGLVKELLPVLDNFERAMDRSGEVDAAWADGIKLVQKQLMDVLKKNGLCEIPADGMFDPELHEAVMQDESEGAEPGSVTAVLQKGYKVNDRIIRHSMVKVAK